MTNQELMQKMKEDMEMRGFLPYSKQNYEHKAKEIIRYLTNQWKK